MQFDEIQALLAAHFPDAHIEVGGDGYHYDVIVVSEAFAGLRPVRRQQLVYAALNDRIVDGSLHAVNMKTFTPDQWANMNASS